MRPLIQSQIMVHPLAGAAGLMASSPERRSFLARRRLAARKTRQAASPVPRCEPRKQDRTGWRVRPLAAVFDQALAWSLRTRTKEPISIPWLRALRALASSSSSVWMKDSRSSESPRTVTARSASSLAVARHDSAVAVDAPASPFSLRLHRTGQSVAQEIVVGGGLRRQRRLLPGILDLGQLAVLIREISPFWTRSRMVSGRCNREPGAAAWSRSRSPGCRKPVEAFHPVSSISRAMASAFSIGVKSVWWALAISPFWIIAPR